MNPILVIKLGGSTGEAMSRAYRDIAELNRHYRIIVVHGVSERMAQLSAERNLPIEMLTSPTGHASRYTPAPVRDLFVDASRAVNRHVVNGLNTHSANAIGVTHDVTIQGERKTAIRAQINGRTRIIRDDYTGSITTIDAHSLSGLLDNGYIPVIPPYANSADGLLNIDGDRAASAIATALHAESLIILSNVRGLYRNFPDESSFVSNISGTQVDSALHWAQGRMKRKILSAQNAINNGVATVIISDGRVARPVSVALNGEGTHFTR